MEKPEVVRWKGRCAAEVAWEAHRWTRGRTLGHHKTSETWRTGGTLHARPPRRVCPCAGPQMSRGQWALALEVKRGVCTMCMSVGCQLHPR